MIEEAQIILHEADEPDFVVDLFDADLLSRDDDGEVDFPAFVTGPVTGGDGGREVVEWIVEIAQSLIGLGDFSYRSAGTCILKAW